MSLSCQSLAVAFWLTRRPSHVKRRVSAVAHRVKFGRSFVGTQSASRLCRCGLLCPLCAPCDAWLSTPASCLKSFSPIRCHVCKTEGPRQISCSVFGTQQFRCGNIPSFEAERVARRDSLSAIAEHIEEGSVFLGAGTNFIWDV